MICSRNDHQEDLVRLQQSLHRNVVVDHSRRSALDAQAPRRRCHCSDTMKKEENLLIKVFLATERRFLTGSGPGEEQIKSGGDRGIGKPLG